jgi:hypothetical protein
MAANARTAGIAFQLRHTLVGWPAADDAIRIRVLGPMFESPAILFVSRSFEFLSYRKRPS